MIIDIIQIIASILLVIAIIMQNRSAGLGSTFGGDGNVYSTRRHMEKSLFNFTIILAAIFLVTARINTIL